jgi:exopolyphosphatase / guanosine-5'-triphosphate,3'-diphosphate pyrophosphatase
MAGLARGMRRGAVAATAIGAARPPTVTPRLHRQALDWVSSVVHRAPAPDNRGLNSDPPLIAAVLDMGASAIRLVIAEIAPDGSFRVLEEASRGALLGRDTFSTGAIRSQTIDVALRALEGFRALGRTYGVTVFRAVATSAVREARNGAMFLDRIRSRTGIEFDIINEAEESRLVYLAARHALDGHGAFVGPWTLLAEVGGGSTTLMLLRRGEPNRSGVYGLGVVRMRQQLDLRRHRHDLQVGLLNRHIANVIEEIRLDIPLRRVTDMIAIGGDIRFAAAQIVDHESAGHVREIPRDAFLDFCQQVQQLDEEAIVERFRLPAVEAQTLVPALTVYRTLLAETAVSHLVVSDASLRVGTLIDLASAGRRVAATDFDRQVLASAEGVGQKYRFDRNHGRHVARLCAQLFDQLVPEHGLGGRERLLLQVAALLHDVGTYIGLRAHHKHSHYLLSATQIFGLSTEETAVVANIARYHRRALPQDSHLPYLALDRQDRLTVDKLASLLRVCNALDAEHQQKVREVRLVRDEASWALELEGTGDLTMEQMAATARVDMFVEVFGRQVTLRTVGVVA